MKKSLILLLAALMVSCMSAMERMEAKKIQENADRLKEIVFGKLPNPSKTTNASEKWFGKIKQENGLTIVYLVNSECSTCIGDYIRFLKTVDRIGENLHVYGIINYDHEHIVSYFLDEYHVGQLKNVVVDSILLEEPFPYGNDRLKNVLILRDGKLLGSIGFADNNLLESMR